MCENSRLVIVKLIAAVAAVLSLTAWVTNNQQPSISVRDLHRFNTVWHSHSFDEECGIGKTIGPQGITVRSDLIEICDLKWKIEMGGKKADEARKELEDLLSHREHIDDIEPAIVKALNDQINSTTSFKQLNGEINSTTSMLERFDARDACIKSREAIFEAHCGPLGLYGMKRYSEIFTKLCHSSVTPDQWAVVCLQACPSHSVNHN